MALGNSINGFRNLLIRAGYQSSNLYMVQIEPPPILKTLGSEFFNMGVREQGISRYADIIDGMCDEITLPSKNLNTSEIKTFGAMYRYPTGTSYSEITMSFMVDKYADIRWLFERWLGLINSDTSHHVSYYKKLVTPTITITKYERGIENTTNGGAIKGLFDMDNVETTVYQVYNAFPFNVGTMSLSSASSQVLRFQVSFYYERYRMLRNERSTEAQKARNNRNKFNNDANRPESKVMSQARNITKKQLEENSAKKKELGLPPFNNINGGNPQ